MAAATEEFPNELDLGEYSKGLHEELLPVIESALDEWHFSVEGGRNVKLPLTHYVSAAVATHLVGDLDV